MIMIEDLLVCFLYVQTFSLEIFKLPFVSITLTVSVADSLKVSFKSGKTRYIDFVANPSTGNTRPLVGETEA